MATGRTSGGRKRTGTRKEKRINQAAIICYMALAVFMFCVAVFPGENWWLAMHKCIFGIFGFMSFVYPIFVIAVCIFRSFGRISKRLKIKITEIGIFAFLINTAANIFVNDGFEGYIEFIKSSYITGISLKNGGALGAFLGGGMLAAFGKTGAAITVIILMLALLMLITGTTVANIIVKLSGIKKNIEDPDNFKEVSKEDVEALKKRKKYNVDISVDDEPAVKGKKPAPLKQDNAQKPEEVTESTGDKSKRVIDSYHSFEEDKNKLKDGEPEKIVMTAEETKAEIKKVETEINNGVISVADEGGYKYPPTSILDAPKYENSAKTSEELDNTANHLVETLRSFGVETKIVNISRGPTVTRYELQPCAGVKISKITNLADDIALNLAAGGVRIEAPIPNKAAVGIEVPNKTSNGVGVREIIESSPFKNAKSKLTVALGKDIAGNSIVADIGKMPHGLIAGATGSGKSVCINSMIISLLYKASPEDVKLLMIDPKVVELGVYAGIPHLLVPVVTDPRKAAGALGWAVQEMENRYKVFAATGVRDLESYNKLCEDNPELQKKPQIVIIIDELADLMITAPNEVEDSINRIAAKARAAGMHLIIATQRPSVDVVTGVIKANIPTRIALAVSSQVDSRTILDMSGAEKLLGRGDMLFNPMGAAKPVRIQGCFVSDAEIEAVVDYIKADHAHEYDSEIQSEIDKLAVQDKKGKSAMAETTADELDSAFEAAVSVVIEQGSASTSYLQRKLRLGYGRASRIIDQMEEMGIVGPQEGTKPREILITESEWLERRSRED